jgi:hypothetical protein
MIAAFLLILALAAALFVGAGVGRRFEAANQRIDGLLAVGERDTAINDEAENGWAR